MSSNAPSNNALTSADATRQSREGQDRRIRIILGLAMVGSLVGDLLFFAFGGERYVWGFGGALVAVCIGWMADIK